MGKPKSTKGPVLRGADMLVGTHMDIWRRFAAIVNMHGTPGDRRPKGK